jgi:uncharacterized protein YdhG (YjbR/CyaY superfamily)
MAKADFKSVDDYLAGHSEEARAVLRRVRSTIRKALPGAEEAISYQIPAYRLDGGYVVYFAGWKQHYSLYPATDHLVAAFQNDLAPYDVSKGTIRFPLSQPVPVRLIERIAKFLAKEATRRTRAKLAPDGRAVVRNPNVPGYTSRVDAAMYRAMHRALLRVLPRRAPGSTQAEVRRTVLAHLPQTLFPGGAKANWWSKMVQLDLEARGLLVREQTKPLRWHLPRQRNTRPNRPE